MGAQAEATDPSLTPAGDDLAVDEVPDGHPEDAGVVGAVDAADPVVIWVHGGELQGVRSHASEATATTPSSPMKRKRRTRATSQV